ncbi:MAG: NHL domain-containing protein [Candidatus Anammoxibacter sp.]
MKDAAKHALLLTMFVAVFVSVGASDSNSEGIITTVAGNGGRGFSGDGGPATEAPLNFPDGVFLDSSGNIFIADNGNNRIRKVDGTTGIITTVAGNGESGFSGDGGPATEASLNFPDGVFLDSSGNIFIAEGGNNRIRKVDGTTGIISTVAGNGETGFSGGDGVPAIEAALFSPTGVFLDSSGNIFIADGGNNGRIRKVDAATGIISTVVGDGTPTIISDGGDATEALLIDPRGVFVDSSGNIFIADGRRIRKVTFGTQSPIPSPTVMPTPTVEPKNGKALLNISFDPDRAFGGLPRFNYSVLVEEVNGVGVTITSFEVDDITFSKEEFEKQPGSNLKYKVLVTSQSCRVKSIKNS